MAVPQIPVPRGGETYTIAISNNENGNSFLTITPGSPDPKTGAMVKYEVDELRIPFGLNSSTAYIHTTWRKRLLGPTGEIIEQGKLTYKPTMVSNEADQIGFITGLGMPILMSMVNGFFRGILGFNNLPVFYTKDVKDEQGNIIHHAGQLIQYTPEELAAPPTNDYHPPVTPIPQP